MEHIATYYTSTECIFLIFLIFDFICSVRILQDGSATGEGHIVALRGNGGGKRRKSDWEVEVERKVERKNEGGKLKRKVEGEIKDEGGKSEKGKQSVSESGRKNWKRKIEGGRAKLK